MAFPPNQIDAQMGDSKTLHRALWNNQPSTMAAYVGGYYNYLYGNDDFKYTDAEGFAPRINYHGTTASPPFDGASGGSVSQQYYTTNSPPGGYPDIRRKGVGIDTSATNQTPYFTMLRNTTAGETYTNGYGTVGGTKDYFYLITKCEPDSTWHCTWYAKSHQLAEMQVHIFGVNDTTGWGSFGYNFATQVGVNAGSSTLAAPSTGGTRYYKTVTLTQSYVKYEMTFTFNGDTDIDGIMMRYDCNTGGSAYFPKDVNVDRFTLHPLNMKMSQAMASTSDDTNLDGITFQTY